MIVYDSESEAIRESVGTTAMTHCGPEALR
jgi:hypothetical protein